MPQIFNKGNPTALDPTTISTQKIVVKHPYPMPLSSNEKQEKETEDHK